MNRLATLRRCATLEEAYVVNSLLRDGGFQSTIGNEHHASVDWFIVSALNGVSVHVPESELIDAGQYLIDMRQSADERLSESCGTYAPQSLHKRRWRKWSMPFIYVFNGHFLLWLPIAFALSFLPPPNFLVPRMPDRALDYLVLGGQYEPAWFGIYPWSWLEYLRVTGWHFIISTALFAFGIFAFIRLSQSKEPKTTK